MLASARGHIPLHTYRKSRYKLACTVIRLCQSIPPEAWCIIHNCKSRFAYPVSLLVIRRTRLISVASPKEKRGSGLRALSEGVRLCNCCLAPLFIIICLKGHKDITCADRPASLLSHSLMAAQKVREVGWGPLQHVQKHLHEGDTHDDKPAASLYHASQ